MLRLTIAVLGAVLIAFQPIQAGAQAACGDRAKMISHLGATYAEQPVAMGLTSSGAVIEVLTSPSGTWTFLIIARSPQAACAVLGRKVHSPFLPMPSIGCPPSYGLDETASLPGHRHVTGVRQKGVSASGQKQTNGGTAG